MIALLLQNSSTPSPSVTSQHQKEKFTRRHTVNVPPLPLVPEDRLQPPIRISQRVTMDFSLLSVPLPDLLQGSDNHKPAAGRRLVGNEEENIQVFSVTLCDCNAFLPVVQISAYLPFTDVVTFEVHWRCRSLYNMFKILPKSFSECPKWGSVHAFTNREAELTFTHSFPLML